MANEQLYNQNQGPIDTESLISFIERAETIKAEIAKLNADLKQIFGEAEGAGFDTKYIKLLIKFRAMDPAQIDEDDALTQMYRSALGI